nr:putative nuclease HARBI1 [Ipomoea batatas]
MDDRLQDPKLMKFSDFFSNLGENWLIEILGRLPSRAAIRLKLAVAAFFHLLHSSLDYFIGHGSHYSLEESEKAEIMAPRKPDEVHALNGGLEFFQEHVDVAEIRSLSPLQKCTASIRQLAYGSPANRCLIGQKAAKRKGKGKMETFESAIEQLVTVID